MDMYNHGNVYENYEKIKTSHFQGMKGLNRIYKQHFFWGIVFFVCAFLAAYFLETWHILWSFAAIYAIARHVIHGIEFWITRYFLHSIEYHELIRNVDEKNETPHNWKFPY